MTFLRTALNAQRKARGESEYSTPDFLKKVREVAKSLNIPQDMLKRGVNVGFSGGEKKRNEILQMALFEPSLCILDEMDSGLDIDALRIAADGVNALRSPDRAMVVITHYQRLLNYIVPDFVHVMSNGRVVKSGDKESGAGAGGFRLHPVRRRSLTRTDVVMNVVLAKTETGRALSDYFALARDRLPGAGKLAEIRRQAFEAYERAGLPHRRIEDWKYTDLRALMREVLPLAPAPDAAALKRAAAALKLQAIAGVRRLVLVDGVFAPDLSETGGLEKRLGIRALRDVLDAGDNALQAQLFSSDHSNPMVALNSAMATDGVVIEIADGTVLAQPLHIVHVASGGTPAAMFTRSLLRLGKDAGVTLVESYIAADGAKAYQAHDQLIVSIGNNARLDHVRLVEDDREAFNISSAIVSIGAHAQLNTFAMTSGAGVSRYQMTVAFAGEGSKVETNGVNLLNGKQHADTTLLMDHAVPNCASREIFRAVVDDRAHSVFQGRIIVQPHAQKTDAKMMTRALLLSDDAEADNKPELEIFADDVTCGHGATTGALDESLLFYLRARGLSEKEAQALLIQAFVGEAIESIANDDLRELAIAAAQRWLEARG